MAAIFLFMAPTPTPL